MARRSPRSTLAAGRRRGPHGSPGPAGGSPTRVADALGGVRVTALRLTPERVLDLLDAARGAA